MALHGKNGHVTAGAAELDINDWNYEYGPNEIVEYPNQDGEAETEPGFESGSGNFTIRVDLAFDVEGTFPSGGLVTLDLQHVKGTPGHGGEGRIGRKNITCNRLSGIQTVVVPFVQHGTWTHP